jgi:septum formation protein
MLILASTSRYRRELLQRLGLPFEVADPGVDEAVRPAEAPQALAQRLAVAKARAVAARRTGAMVIGSDQVCAVDDAVLGKPGDAETARAQLARLSGRIARFHTAVCVAVGEGSGIRHAVEVDETEVVFRTLDAATIERYVARDQPLDCAGSFRCEGLGIVLFEAIRGEDPSALVGLPLIRTARLLRGFGVDPLSA